jgi:xylulokinase
MLVVNRERRPGVFVGIDLGTSGCRAIAFATDGSRVRSAEAPSSILYEADGSATVDPEATWRTVCALLPQIVNDQTTLAVGVCAHLAFLGIDAAGRPTTPAFLWSDRRASEEAERLAATLGADAYGIGRRRVTPEVLAAKILWVAHRRPGIVARTRRWLSLKDFVVARLTGETITDPTHASYTLLFDVEDRTWSSQLLAGAGIDAATLPPVREATELAGLVTEKAAAAAGLSAGTPVAVGAPDGTAGAVGAGAVREGVTVDVAGSTDVIFRTTRAPAAGSRDDVVVNAFAVPGLWAVGGPTGLTGGAIHWLAQLLGYGSTSELYADLGPALRLVPPGCDGISFRTALTGERFPGWDARAAGMIAGVRPEHGRAHLLRAAEEGAAFLVGDGLDAMVAAAGPIRTVIVTGGVSGRPEALQTRADAWGRIVETVREPDASALGASLFGAVAARSFPSMQEAAASMVHPGARFVPSGSNVKALAAARQRWSRTLGDRSEVT